MVNLGQYPRKGDRLMSEQKSYHFDLGNSSTGPIGFCACVTADSPKQALAALKDALPNDLQLSMAWGDVARGVEYMTVYINPDAITVDDIDEVNDLETDGDEEEVE